MLLETLLLGLFLAAPHAPTIEVAVNTLCADQLVDREFCSTLSHCGPFRKGQCAANDHPDRTADEDWTEWSCEVDLRNGYLRCSAEAHLTTGPGAGDVIRSTWDAALFIGKRAIVVGVALRGDRPEASFYSLTPTGWARSTPLPPLGPKDFKLDEPAPPKGEYPQFAAKFFVELTLPRIGTTVSAEGRWVNAYRDDSGYGQSDHLLSAKSLELSWDATRARFTLAP